MPSFADATLARMLRSGGAQFTRRFTVAANAAAGIAGGESNGWHTITDFDDVGEVDNTMHTLIVSRGDPVIPHPLPQDALEITVHGVAPGGGDYDYIVRKYNERGNGFIRLELTQKPDEVIGVSVAGYTVGMPLQLTLNTESAPMAITLTGMDGATVGILDSFNCTSRLVEEMRDVMALAITPSAASGFVILAADLDRHREQLRVEWAT